MSTRKEFYVVTSVFDKGLSSRAIAVYAYLSYCADKNGECFPAVKRIAYECKASCSTIRRALKELEEKGVISSTPRMMRAEEGGRQLTNLYRLLALRLPVKAAQQPDETKKAEADIAASKPQIPDVPEAPVMPETTAKPERRRAAKPLMQPRPTAPSNALPNADDNGLRELLDRLDISRYYEDKIACKAIELAITDMWFADETKVGGITVNKYRMRNRLNELDIDAMDEIMERLEDDDVNNRTAYIKSCIYNAPLFVNSRIAVQSARLRRRFRECREEVRRE